MSGDGNRSATCLVAVTVTIYLRVSTNVVPSHLPPASPRHFFPSGSDILRLKAYFVRKATDGEVVGLFLAPSSAKLAALVDEHCDPTLCEYATAVSGGLVVPAVTRAKWPMKAGRSSTSTGLEKAVLTQAWEDDLDAATSTLEWMPLQQASERLLRQLGKGE